VVENVYINEIQSFRWLALVPGLVTLLFAVLCYFQIVLKKQVGNRPAPSWLLVVFFLFTATVTAMLGLQKLTLSITNKAVYINFGVFASKQVIPLTDIKSIAVRKYNGPGEFSGWGVKSNAHEQSYTVSGDEGVEIILKNGKMILVGTQKPKEMQRVINQYFY